MNCVGIIAALNLIFKRELPSQDSFGEAQSFVKLNDDSIVISNFRAKLVPGSLTLAPRSKDEQLSAPKPVMVTMYQPGKLGLIQKNPALHSQLLTKKAKLSPEGFERQARIPEMKVSAKPALRNLSFPTEVRLPVDLLVAQSKLTPKVESEQISRFIPSATVSKDFMDSVRVPNELKSHVGSVQKVAVERQSDQVRNANNSSPSKGFELPAVTSSKPITKAVTTQVTKQTSGESASQFAPLAPNMLTVLETKLVNISVVGAPLRTIVSSLSTQSGINVLLISKPEQEVTINMRSVTLNEALKHLSVICGLKIVKVKNTVVIGEEAALKSAYPKEYSAEYTETGTSTDSANKGGGGGTATDPSAEPIKPKEISRVITTNHLAAMNLVNSLSAYLQKKNVSIVALPNTLIPMVSQAAGGAGAGAGAAGGQAGGGMGAGAPVAGGGAGAVGGAGDVSQMRSKRLLVVGPPDEVEAVIKMIRENDVQRRQVEITVLIHDVANDALKEEGFNWTLGAFSLTENNAGSINFGSFARTGLSFQSAMKGLEQTQKAKLLASPNVTVMDGEQSTILVGERRQFPIVNGTTPQGQFIFSTQEQNVGISLQVAADIADDGTITMAVHPMVSSIIGFLQVNGGSYPQISTRESSSTLTVKDGQTILMGGLLRDEEIKNFEQLPLLGKIPFFGELFKYRKTVKNSSQLIISITPKIIKPQ